LSSLNKAEMSRVARSLGIVGFLTALVISPDLSYDPVNLIKMLFFVTGALFLISSVLTREFARGLKPVNAFETILLISLACLLLVSVSNLLVANEIPREIQLWGVFGRSTGLATIFSFIIIFFVSSFTFKVLEIRSVLKFIVMTNLCLATYAVLQSFGIDFFDWSVEQTFATLGNINFSSAYFGFSSVVIFRFVVDVNIEFYRRVSGVILIGINSLLIFNSGSLQGLMYTVVGVSVILVFMAYRRMKSGAILFAGLSSIISSVVLILYGTLGRGPFGSILFQETMIFRSDYWRAGLAMFKENWLTGLGLDAYGLYYRQYRDQAAVLRTGDARVSDSAHNVFIDLAVGSGIFGLSTLFLLFVVVILQATRLLRFSEFDDDSIMLFACVLVFLLYCIVGINNIAVMYWFYVFSGAIVARGRTKDTQGQSGSKKIIQKAKSPFPDSQNDYEVRANFVLRGFVGLTIGLAICLPPFVSDYRFMSAWNTGDIQTIESAAFSRFASNHLREKALEFAISRNDGASALRIASKIVESNPRSFYAWNVLGNLLANSQTGRSEANERVRGLDPIGQLFREGSLGK